MLHTHRRWTLALGLLAFALVSLSASVLAGTTGANQRPSLRQRFERSNPGREDFSGFSVAKRYDHDGCAGFVRVSLACA